MKVPIVVVVATALITVAISSYGSSDSKSNWRPGAEVPDGNASDRTPHFAGLYSARTGSGAIEFVSPWVSRELAQHATRPLIIVPWMATASTMPRV